MTTEFINFNVQNGVAVIRLNRPEKFNSFVREMALDIQERLDYCQTEKSIRAVVLTGNGKAFCAGQDLKEATDDNGIELKNIVSEHYNPIILKIRKLNKPVIAAVNGVAAGAGANIALCCDLVIAGEAASFIQAFSKIGLIPDSGGTYFLPKLIGTQKASALMMTGEKVSAREAEKMNMIYKVVDDAELESTAVNLAEKLAKMPTKALALTKKLLNESAENTLEQQLQREYEEQRTAGQSHDYKEGTTAFLEKRKPVFKGE